MALFALLLSAPVAFSQAQSSTSGYSRLNAFGILGEYSNNSSQMLLANENPGIDSQLIQITYAFGH